MPLKINVGVCKKIGLPDYGSAGSHCDVELEMDHSVLNDPNEFQKRVRHAYSLCRQAVEDELPILGGSKASFPLNNSSDQRERVIAAERKLQPGCNARALPPERNDNRFVASPKQMEFIGRLCKGIKGLDNKRLNAYCQQEFGKVSNQLSAQDASKLIDMLKDAKQNGGLA